MSKDAVIGGNAPWEKSAEYIIKRMRKIGGWFYFGPYDNISALKDLVKAGDAEMDKNHDNVIGSMNISLRARATSRRET